MNDISAEEIFRKLVSIDTTSSRSNQELADYVVELLEPVAGEIIRDPSDDGTKTNLMVRIGPEPEHGGEGLVLSGHMDTVPAVEPAWKSSPFELTDAGDRWIARGAADMKGFLALSIDRARRTSPASLHAPLVLHLSYDEEVGTLGAKHWVDHQKDVPLPRAVIIGEPTELQIVTMHKGHLKLRVTIGGVSAHSGYPHLGVNAIEKAGTIIEALSELRHELETERNENCEAFEPVPWVPLNMGEIHGGTAINIVPDRVELSIGLRLLPGLDSSEMISRIKERIQGATSDPSTVSLSLINESPPMKLDESAAVVHTLRELTGRKAVHAVSFATDAGWLQRLGLDCVLFGPGSIEVAHKPNEYIPKEQFRRAEQILEGAVRELCMQETR